MGRNTKWSASRVAAVAPPATRQIGALSVCCSAWLTRWAGSRTRKRAELSGEQCKTIHCTRAELDNHFTHLLAAGDALELDFLNLGMQPVSPLDDIQWIPKTRYHFMAPYMEQVGRLGHRMMKQTASVQVNFDFSDETDAMTKFKVGMGLVPILTAMFANSPFSDGKLNGYMSMRSHVWTDTDPRRCGLLPFAFSDQAGFED